jgi:hypothetical protein
MTELARALAARCDLLGFEALPLALLAIDVAVLLALAGGVVGRLERASGEARWGAVRTLLASGLVLVGTVVASATLLGAARQLSSRNLLLLHAMALALFAAAEWSRGQRVGPRALSRWALRPLAAASAPVRGLLSAEAWRRQRLAESALLVALLGVLGFYLVLALFTLPLNWDSNTYRLSRVALWLQEGSLYHFPTNDTRQNWVGQNADLVMLWLTGFFRREYPLVKLAQYGGGLACCLAVYQLGAWLGMARFWRLGAAAILVGIPTVGTQFISSQTDLFTAGCLAAGLAFLPSALRSGRLGDWLLVGLGSGLAVGAKATVLYWGPGLVALLVGWAWLERSPPRAVLRGGVLAAAVALPLCGFNFLLNSFDFASPVAPAYTLGKQAQIAPDAPAAQVSTALLGITWQLFEPHSNPLLPSALHEPVFESLLERLATRRWDFRNLHAALPDQGGWRVRGLNEDEASFGLLVALTAALGALGACAGALHRHGTRDRRRVALLFVALIGFFAVYAWLSTAGANQYRYFCLLAPFTALLAADLFARRRVRAVQALGVLLIAAQLATAVHVGRESRNQGLRVLRDPGAARWSPRWSETRRLAEMLGEKPLAAGLTLQGDSWLAPLLRSGSRHDWQLFETAREMNDRPTVGTLMRAHGLDLLVADPYLLSWSDTSDLRLRTVESSLGWRRAIYEPLPPVLGGGGPRAFAIHGIHSDRWSAPRARFHLAGWSLGRFELAVSNPTPLARQIVIRSRRERIPVALAAGGATRLSVAVAARDTVTLEITPAFVPEALGLGPDVRELGLLLAPLDIVESDGVDPDRWTQTKASFRLTAWTKGVFALELGNPTPLVRTLSAESSLERASWELEPGARRVIALAVEPQDRVVLEISPPFVPSRHGAGDDDRELGVLLDEIPGGG